MREKPDLPSESAEAQSGNLRLKARRKQRASPSKIEDTLWQCLRNRRFHRLKFRRQHSVGPYIADFYCEEYRLVVEADGPVHESAEQKPHDASRDAWMRSRGMLVVRLPPEEILMATDRALAQIERALRDAGRAIR